MLKFHRYCFGHSFIAFAADTGLLSSKGTISYFLCCDHASACVRSQSGVFTIMVRDFICLCQARIIIIALYVVDRISDLTVIPGMLPHRNNDCTSSSMLASNVLILLRYSLYCMFSALSALWVMNLYLVSSSPKRSAWK